MVARQQEISNESIETLKGMDYGRDNSFQFSNCLAKEANCSSYSSNDVATPCAFKNVASLYLPADYGLTQGCKTNPDGSVKVLVMNG